MAAICLCIAFPVNSSAQFTGLSVSAASAILIEADTGRVLYEKNAEQPMAMASTTKMMTAWLTLEAAAVDDRIVTVTQEMLAEGSSLGLQPGWKIRLSQLAAGMLIVSGNDAARAAAIAISGSEEAFADQMNARAAEIGMFSTHFVTASGLDAEKHHSTARDMALLAANALQNEAFRSIVSSQTLSVEFVEPEKSVVLSNHNKLLRMLDGCIGVKTGYTRKAGRCLVSAVERDGVRLICVTLNAPDDWTDHIRLYEEAFASVKVAEWPVEQLPAYLPVVGGIGQYTTVGYGELPRVITVGEEATVSVRVFTPHFLYAPVTAGKQIGKIVLYVDDNPAGEAVLMAGESVPAIRMEKTWWQKFLLLFRIGE